MAEQQVILVTGAAGYWGSRVARGLLVEPEVHVIGVDRAAAEEVEIEGLDYIQADPGNPLLAELLRVEQVKTVCHLAFEETARPNETSFEYNVMGAIKLLGACAESGVQRVVLKSSTMVYGAAPNNSAFLMEDAPLRGGRRAGYNRYRCEIESFINGFRRQAPELDITVLRFANVVGPTADTPMNRYLSNRLPPTLLGFDPMMQVIHEDDVVGALVHAAHSEVSGPFNIAADPPMPLLRILALAGRLPLPLAHPLVYRGSALLGARRVATYLPFETDYLRYRWVADLTRMRELLGFFPQHMANEALEALARHLRTAPFTERRDGHGADAEALQAIIDERRARREASDKATEQPQVEGSEHEAEDVENG